MITMRIFVRSFGCSANLSDSEVIAGCLSLNGHELVNSEETAELIIFNTCAVKGPTENRIIDAIKKTSNKLIIIAGCLPLINLERISKQLRYDAVVGPAVGDKIVNITKRVANGEKIIDLQDALIVQPRLNLPHIKTNPLLSVISVSYGCLGSCAYCCVKHARGNLRSYKIAEIVERAKIDLINGVREFWITGQDVGCFGRDIQTNLVSLLNELTALKGDFQIRVGMMTPNLVTPMIDDLIEVFHSPKLFKFLHLPVQSGDDQVLRQMNRFYTIAQFKKIIDTFRLAFPEITISTDVICGFPGESIEAHQNTLNLLEEIQPDIVNISKFFARPKTTAWNMRSIFIQPDVINQRTSEVAALVKRIGLKRNASWIDWVGDVFIDETGKIPGSWIGRNFAYKPIVIKSSENLMGKTLKVKVIKAYSTHLVGIIK